MPRRNVCHNKPMQLQVGVKAIIRNKDGALLLLRRNNVLSTDSEETSWDIPGGRINPDESLEYALRREMREEIGCDISVSPRLIAAQDIFVDTKNLHVVRLIYAIEVDTTLIITLSNEHGAYQWVEPDTLASLSIEPYLAEVLKGVWR